MVQISQITSTKLKTLLFILILLNGIIQARAQTADLVLNTPVTAAATYTATHSISLNDGFSANGVNGTVGFSIVAPSLFSCVPLNATLSSNQNYISTYSPRIPMTDGTTLGSRSVCEVNQSIQYFDGLGRPLQTVQVKASPDGTRDVIQPIAYDAFGREATKYLPYTDGTAGPGSYRSTALADASGAYTGSAQYLFYHQNPATINYSPVSIPSAATGFEPSPLNRVVEQGAPGTDWQLGGHSNRIIYTANDGTSYPARQFGVSIDASGQRSPIDQGTYGADQLYVTISQNENWLQTQGVNPKLNTTEEYKDKEGRIVLKRTYNNNNGTFETLSTYYVYDDFGNLCYVLPPGVNADTAQSGPNNQAILNNLCYQYGYDGRNRQVSKQLPGKGIEYVVYNTLDQVVATQDGNQRLNNQWMITKYDALGRVVMTGSWSNGNTAISPQSLTALVYAQSINWENKDNTQGYGYSMTNTYPHTLDNVLTVNYYDNYITPYTSPYTYAVNSQISPAMPVAASAMTKGLLTMSLTAVLNGTNNNINPGNMLGTVYYYDDLGRVIQSYEMHYLGGKSVNAGNYDQVSHSYDFTNAITQTVRVHHNATSSSSPATITIANSYVYDHMGRKRQTFEQINGGSNVLLSQNDYNEVGQELNKHLHSVDNGVSFLQNVSYAYNERGWLNTLNTDGNLLNFSLSYNTSGTGITPQWNGNISQVGYNVNKGTNTGAHQFIYNYDGLNRLTQAQSTGSLLDESLSYDKMGNISSLTRGGASAASLAYTYTDVNGNYSNQLQKVLNNNAAFRSYGYDANGNATSDGGAQTINYNLLDLPQSVVQGGITKASYIYSATGNKLRNTGSDGNWDYVNGIVYQNGVISFIQTEEGRANYNVQNGTYNYEYNLKDHLGNTRVSIDKDPTAGTARVIQEDEYYSFGLRKIGGYDFASNNRYLYNGKEIQTDLANQYDYGARFYDPVIGRFNTIDPLSEKSRRFAPYVYGNNNPIRFIDPDGMEATDWVYGKNGKPRWDNNVTSATDKDLKAGDTYMGKTATYTAVGGYTAQLNSDKTWNYVSPTLTPQPEGPSLAEAVRANMPTLDLAYGIATGVAIVAAGEVGGGEAAGNFLMGQAARKSEFLGGLAENLVSKGVQRVFWSGEGALSAATNYAESMGGTTLEMTRAGQNLQNLIRARNIPWAEARPMWQRLSSAYAEGASGTAHFFPGAAVNPGSIWMTLEKNILLKNGVNIISH